MHSNLGSDLRFLALDQRAIKCPKSETKTVAGLTAYLTADAQTELEKVRVIFRWVTQNIAYNMKGYLRGDYGDNSPKGVLKSRESVCQGCHFL